MTLQKVYHTSRLRQIEQKVSESLSGSPSPLMERAGLAAFLALKAHWPAAKSIAVVCGKGNNGGDGYVLARLARQNHYSVCVWQLAPIIELQGDARVAAEQCQEAGVLIKPFSSESFMAGEWDVIVDGLLGIGLTGKVTGDYAHAIECINGYKIREKTMGLLALDVPSGIHADTGQALGSAIEADLTVTFIGLKQGLLTADGLHCAGKCLLETLSIPESILNSVEPSANCLSPDYLTQTLVKRHRNTYKGHYGHVLVIGGNQGMLGAVRLAAEASIRVGAGLTTLATRKAHAALIASHCPEIMAWGVNNADDLTPLIKKATVIVIGPGLGQDDWAEQLLKYALSYRLPTVIDADALNLIAQKPDDFGFNDALHPQWIMTPHPGEAARLLGSNMTTSSVQSDRFSALKLLRQHYKAHILLKGAGTLISATPSKEGKCKLASICPLGNPGMATGGMGDVLSGVMGGLMAQGLLPEVAARSGVVLHACAADAFAISRGERGMMPTDLMPYLQELANPRLKN